MPRPWLLQARCPCRILPFPAIQLPAELDALLRKRGEISGSSALTDVFTEDAQILRFNSGDWGRGKKAVHDFLGFVAKGIRYSPNVYEVDGANGHIAGTVRLGEPAEEVLNFLLVLKKGTDGQSHAGEGPGRSAPRVRWSPPPSSAR